MAIVVLLAILVFSYRQVIDAYPGGGGAYAVSRANLGPGASLVAGASLIVDYTLTVAVSIAAGVGALTSAFPSLTSATVPICLGILAVITLLNLRGLGETARAFLLPTMLFIVGLLAIIAIGLIHPLALHAPQPGRSLLSTHGLQTVSVLLVLKAFSAGCSALTGVEAIANGVPLFKEPRAVRAKRTELLLGVILGVMLLGLAVLARALAHRAPIEPDRAQPDHGHGRRSALGLLPRVADHHRRAGAGRQHLVRRPARSWPACWPRDNYLPHLFSLRGDRQVFANGIWVLAVLSGGAADRRGRQHQRADPALRHRGLHRIHPVPGRAGRPLVADPPSRLAPPGQHQRLRGAVTGVGHGRSSSSRSSPRGRGWWWWPSRRSSSSSGASTRYYRRAGLELGVGIVPASRRPNGPS